jgi:hypothetical protein
MGWRLFRLVVLGAIGLGLGCGAGASTESASSQTLACGEEGDRPYRTFTEVPTLENCEISIGGKRYVLPMKIELHQDKIGLWCKGPVDLCFGMSDQEGQPFEICEATDTTTDDPWTLHSPQVEESSDESKKLLLAVLKNAVDDRFSPEEIQQIRRGEHPCKECSQGYLIYGYEEFDRMRQEQNICEECDWAYMGYVEAVALLDRRVR